jgi:hypothetical protein
MRDVFSWLHLSDIHVRLTQNGVGGLVLERLAAALRPDALPVRPQAILLTGDAAFSGQAAEYDQLLGALENVARVLGLGLEHVYAVPGNHDVQRACAGTAEHGLIENIRLGTSKLDRALESPASRDVLLQRLAPFRQFAARLAVPSGSPGALADVAWCHSFGDNPKLRLVGLNTALLANDGFDAKQLRLGQLQLELFRNLSPDEIVLALSHHPLSWLGDEEQIAPWLETSAHVHLNGHVHVHGVKRTLTGVGLELVTVAAGAAFEAESGSERFAFSFGSIRADAGGRRELRVWPWAWAPQLATFEPDHASLPRGSSRLHVEFPLRPAAAAAPRSPVTLPARTAHTAYRTPIAIYVVWHPHFVKGAALARDIYDTLCGDPTVPFSGRIGIPVYYRSTPVQEGAGLPLRIDFDAADETIVVALVDSAMLANADGEGWRQYLNELALQAKPGRFFGIACHKGGENLVRGPASWDLLYHRPDVASQRLGLRRKLLTALAVILAGSDGASLTKLTLFLSHSTRDGGALAKEMRETIGDDWPVQVFFDKLDIPLGHDFGKVIANTINPAAAEGIVGLVALLSDSYSSRDWCQREVLFAKRKNHPMLVVHMLNSGENRSFPYLGNVPSVVWAALGSSNKERATALVERMFELILASQHTKKTLGALCRLYDIEEPLLLARPPELLDVASASADEILVYPDPPLTHAELSVFGAAQARLFTPTQLAVESAK